MVKSRVCAWRMCATCHSLEIHPASEDRDSEMPDQDNTPLPRPLRESEASGPTLESLRELARKLLPNTITFIPQRMRTMFARIYRSKLKDLASLMREGGDTGARDQKLAGVSDTRSDFQRRRGRDGTQQSASLKSGRLEPETNGMD